MTQPASHSALRVSHSELREHRVVPQHRVHILPVGFRERRHFEFPEFPAKAPKLEASLDAEVPETVVRSGNFGNAQVFQVTER